jgi:hypothetical protein
MRIDWKRSVLVVAAFAIGIAGGIAYAKGKAEYVLVPAGGAKFVPLDPKIPFGGVEIAALSGDPKTGPAAFELKLPKGRPAPVHWHSSDYYLWTVDGVIKHWLPGKEADAKPNPPGTFWFQPGGVTGAHGDECLSDSCTVFMYMLGKFDVIPVADNGGAKK